MALIGLDVDDDDIDLEDLAELGAPTGYLVNVMTEDDDTIRQRLLDSALIVVPDNFEPDELRSALMGAPLEGMKAAFESGAVLLVEGRAATLFGGTVLLADGEALDGFGWIEEALLLAGSTTLEQSEAVRTALAGKNARLAVGITMGSALALGPEGEVENWGQRQVTVVLGSV
jgi:hypothetical protein